MDFKTALANKAFQSGDVVAYTDPVMWYDRWIEYCSGKYYHVGIIHINPTTNKVELFQVDFHDGVVRSELTDDIPFDLIKTGITWDEDVDIKASMALGESYSYVNFALVIFKLNFDFFGYICSTFVGDVLNEAKENLNISGLTPTVLVNDLISKGSKIISITP